MVTAKITAMSPSAFKPGVLILLCAIAYLLLLPFMPHILRAVNGYAPPKCLDPA